MVGDRVYFSHFVRNNWQVTLKRKRKRNEELLKSSKTDRKIGWMEGWKKGEKKEDRKKRKEWRRKEERKLLLLLDIIQREALRKFSITVTVAEADTPSTIKIYDVYSKPDSRMLRTKTSLRHRLLRTDRNGPKRFIGTWSDLRWESSGFGASAADAGICRPGGLMASALWRPRYASAMDRIIFRCWSPGGRCRREIRTQWSHDVKDYRSRVV